MRKSLILSLVAVAALGIFAIAIHSAPPLKPEDYYFDTLGLIDEGPPVYIITEKARWDANCGDFSTVPVKEAFLPDGFYEDPGNPDAVTYRYDGPTMEGHDALLNKGYIENIMLDQPCP